MNVVIVVTQELIEPSPEVSKSIDWSYKGCYEEAGFLKSFTQPKLQSARGWIKDMYNVTKDK